MHWSMNITENVSVLWVFWINNEFGLYNVWMHLNASVSSKNGIACALKNLYYIKCTEERRFFFASLFTDDVFGVFFLYSNFYLPLLHMHVRLSCVISNCCSQENKNTIALLSFTVTLEKLCNSISFLNKWHVKECWADVFDKIVIFCKVSVDSEIPGWRCLLPTPPTPPLLSWQPRSPRSSSNNPRGKGRHLLTSCYVWTIYALFLCILDRFCHQ